MSFYSLLYGVLFLASCRQSFALFGTPQRWAAVFVSLVIFNDTMNTTDVLTRKNAPHYTLWMKILDLLSFFLLSGAILALDPKGNPFQITPSDLQTSWFHRVTPWPFLTLYWLATLAWNWLAKAYYAGEWPSWLRWTSRSMVLPPFILALLALRGYSSHAFEAFTVGVFAIYSLMLKPIFIKQPKD